ncbi:hypothetical protein ACQEPB_15455 [Novosphingobium fluoreni]|uniref:hypothetical protein n=1 Tax=Novosphingobium fluoreni TaxID=1391222 RepID=UPI003DA05212
MTRTLHEATRVQRGDPADLPGAEVERGYEQGDAPPGKVVLGVAAFVAVMFVGMGAAGLLTKVWNDAHQPSAAAATREARQPPPPRLLAEPERERYQIEGTAKRRLATSAMPIDRAMEQIARRGWGEDAAASTTPDVARDHREAAQ